MSGLRVRLRRELRRRRIAPLLDEDRLDRLPVAHSSRSYGKSVSTSQPSSVTSRRSSSAGAAVAVAVEARLDRNHVARDERLAPDPAQAGPLVHLQPDAVAGRVEEPVLQHLALLLVQLRLVAMLVEEVADEAMDVAASHARLDGRHGEVERLLREPVVLAELVGRRADRERACEIGEARRLAVARKQVEQHDVVRADRAGAAVVPGRGLRAVRDHELLGGGAVLAERPARPRA